MAPRRLQIALNSSNSGAGHVPPVYSRPSADPRFLPDLSSLGAALGTPGSFVTYPPVCSRRPWSVEKCPYLRAGITWTHRISSEFSLTEGGAYISYVPDL